MHVLVVDDWVDAADALAALLALHGHDVDVAYDGVEALFVAAERPLQAAVLDLSLPKLDGFELAKRLRHEYGAHLRLIAYSARGDADTSQRAMACGFDRHLTKPAEVADLLNALEG